MKTALVPGLQQETFMGVLPYEGRYDAQLPTAFAYTKADSPFTTSIVASNITGEMRNLKWLRYANGSRVLMLAGTNQPLTFLKQNLSK